MGFKTVSIRGIWVRMRITTPVWVVLISSIKKGLLTNWAVSHLVGIFDLMDISVVNSHGICRVLHTKEMELLLFKIVDWYV